MTPDSVARKKETVSAEVPDKPKLQIVDGDSADSVPVTILVSETPPVAEEPANNEPIVNGSALRCDSESPLQELFVHAVVKTIGPPDKEIAGESQSDSPARNRRNAGREIRQFGALLINFIWSNRAAFFVLAAIALVPKSIFLWLAVIALKPIVGWLYKRSSLGTQQKIRLSIPAKLRHSQFRKDLAEGAEQGLPFVKFWTYMFCFPFAAIWMSVHYFRSYLPDKAETAGSDEFVFTQNRDRSKKREATNFYSSRAFALVILAFFASGIPAFTSFFLYEKLVEPDMNHAKLYRFEPRPIRPGHHHKRGDRLFMEKKLEKTHWFNFFMIPVAKKQMLAPDGEYVEDDPTSDQTSYYPWLKNPTRISVFLAHFYMAGLGAAIAVLFMRAYFLFPLNFLKDEHDVLVTARGVKRTHRKNWFYNLLTFNRFSASSGGPDCLDWNQIKSLRLGEQSLRKLHPLPEKAFKRTTLIYKILNRFAALVDGATANVNEINSLVFSSVVKGPDYGENIKIDLNDLNREQRAKLFYSIQQWAPKIEISDNVQVELLGSSVLKDTRYTQLWFDLFASRSAAKRQSALSSGDILKKGDYVIQERLNSGGQATAYLASTTNGAPCVLKEFILAESSSNPAALLESARDFENEVTLLSQLKHPGIVNLLDFFTEAGRVYVVLEYINGETLRQRVTKSGAMTEAEVNRIATSVTDVLKYLHSFDPPIVHRDVTPENILITSDGSVRLIDFSLAERTDGRTTTDSCGKQSFTPPEQFREEACPQSDIYGLGATMYFMLTGSKPKPITVSSPAKKVSTISQGMNAIVERATRLDLTDRYECVEWLKLELAKLEIDSNVTP